MKSAKRILPCFILLAAFIFSANELHARYRKKYGYNYEPSTAPGGWMITAYSVFSYANYMPQPGTLNVKFPYTLTNRSTGIASTSQFTSTTENLTGTGKWVYPGVGLEIGKDNFSVEAAMGWYFHQWSDHLYFGINYRFILNKLHAHPERYTFGSTSVPGKYGIHLIGDFPVKISCGIFYWQPIWKIGEINISDKEFYALGHVMQDRDSLIARGSGNVTVLFHQNYVALTPNFSIGYRPQQGRLDLSFRISPMITIAERGGLRFVMRNSGNVEWAPTNGISLESVIPLSTIPMNASFNGERIDSSPFRLRGVMYTLRIGFRLI